MGSREIPDSSDSALGVQEVILHNAPKWYRERNYAHFDRPLSPLKALTLVSNPSNIESRSFWPFLYFEIKTRRYRKTPKIREIRYASHQDGYIYAYYAHQLAQHYEQLLVKHQIGPNVLAYRSGIGSNIDFAKEAFDQIERLSNCVAIGFDIENFFDSVDHHILKEQWLRLLGLSPSGRLPSDHFAIFKSLTRYAYVDRAKCYERLGYSKKTIKEKRPICTPAEFRAKIRGSKSHGNSLVKINRTGRGIPQGSSISAVLANVYLFEFDVRVSALVRHLGGEYRRYSDDILIIVSSAYESAIKHFVLVEMSKLKLKINTQKTTESHFYRCGLGHLTLRHGDKPFQYLGFVFDGQRRLIRSQTLSRYWGKVKFAVARAKKKARRATRLQRNSTVFKREIYTRFTHLGSRNFISYAKRAAKTMVVAGLWNKAPAWCQVKNHIERLNRLLC